MQRTGFDRRGFLAAAPAAALAASPLAAQGAQSEDAPRTFFETPQGVSVDLNPELPGKTPNTKFAVNVEMWWTRLPFLDRIRQAAAFGYPAIEFWPLDGKDLNAVARLTGELGIEIAQFTAWGFSPGMNNPKNHDVFEEAIRSACAEAKRLNCRKMTVVGGNDQPGMTQEEMHDHIITALKRVAPIAEKAEVMLILEPMNIRVDHKGHSLYGSPPSVAICREVDSPMVKLNWDFYHMHITEGDLCRRLAEGFDQVGYLQLADNPGRNEPGTGEIFYNRVLAEAKRLGYEDYVGLECRPAGSEAAAALGVYRADIW